MTVGGKFRQKKYFICKNSIDARNLPINLRNGGIPTMIATVILISPACHLVILR